MDNKLVILLPSEMKDWVNKKSQDRFQSKSEYIRDLIRKDKENDRN